MLFKLIGEWFVYMNMMILIEWFVFDIFVMVKLFFIDDLMSCIMGFDGLDGMFFFFCVCGLYCLVVLMFSCLIENEGDFVEMVKVGLDFLKFIFFCIVVMIMEDFIVIVVFLFG